MKDDELFLQSTKTFSILPTSSPKSYSPALNGFSPKFVSHENLSDSISNSTSPPWTPRTLPSCQDVGLSLYTFVSNFEHLYTSVRNHEQLIMHMCPISSNFTHWCAMISSLLHVSMQFEQLYEQLFTLPRAISGSFFVI